MTAKRHYLALVILWCVVAAFSGWIGAFLVSLILPVDLGDRPRGVNPIYYQATPVVRATKTPTPAAFAPTPDGSPFLLDCYPWAWLQGSGCKPDCGLYECSGKQ